jgi:hypothetical protein
MGVSIEPDENEHISVWPTAGARRETVAGQMRMPQLYDRRREKLSSTRWKGSDYEAQRDAMQSPPRRRASKRRLVQQKCVLKL